MNELSNMMVGKTDEQIMEMSGGVFSSSVPQKIETIYMEQRGYSSSYYKDEVLEATADKDGNVVFSYAKGGSYEKGAKTNRTNYVTFDLIAGAVNGETFNIDWSKVNSISGQTYSLRSAARAAGLKWDREAKRWVR